MALSFIRKRILKVFKVTEVFTPTTAAKVAFVNRTTVENDLDIAINTPGMQIIIFGHTGSGKTTLIENRLTQLKKNFVSTSCVTGTTIQDLLLRGFDSLGIFYTETKSLTTSHNVAYKLSSKAHKEVKAQYSNIESRISQEISSEISGSRTTSNSQVLRRAVPIQLNPQRLAQFFGIAKCIWVIEDAHKMEEAEKRQLAQMMKVFMDTASSYSETKIIAIGAVATGREVTNYDQEMNERITELHVPLLNDREVLGIIEKGESAMNIKVDNKTKKQIVKLSNQLASTCHQLCLNLCHIEKVRMTKILKKEISESSIDEVIQMYLRKKSDSLQEEFDSALRVERRRTYNNPRLILQAFINLDKERVSHSELLSQIRVSEPTYPQGNLTIYLQELCSPKRHEVLRYDSASNMYEFSNPLMKAYMKMKFENIKPESIDDILG